MEKEILKSYCLYAEEIEERVKEGERMILFLKDGKIIDVDFVSVENGEKENDEKRVLFNRIIWFSRGAVTETLYVDMSDISACIFGDALDTFDCLDEYLQEDNLELSTKRKFDKDEVVLCAVQNVNNE